MTAVVLTTFGLCSVLVFPLIAQPLSLGLSIILATLFICILRAIFISRWYAYILFLIYVGGLLVIFAYVAALSPNILFSSTNTIIFFSLIFFPLLYIFTTYRFLDLSTISSLNSWLGYKNIKSYGIELVSPQHISILVALGVILLLNLIVVVKICYYQYGALRSFNNP
jgi:NADH-ubiquinone oxidoreductase chain 6